MEPCSLEQTLHRVVDTCESYSGLAPFGLRVEQTADRGRRVVSTRGFRRGETLFRTEPLVGSVHEPWKRQVCNHVKCWAYTPRSRQPFTCSGCRQVFYCSATCQEADGVRHSRFACSAFANMAAAQQANKDLREYPMLSSYLRMLIELYAARLPRSEHRPCVSEDALSLLQSCRFTVDAETIKDFYMLARTFRGLVAPEWKDAVHPAYVMDFLCRERCNSFGYTDEAGDMFGWAVFAYASFFNHSCYPNAVKRLRKGVLELFAVRDIEEGDEINICYVTLDDNVKDRRQVTKDVFLFDCDCQRCVFEAQHGEALAREKYNDLIDNICSCGSIFVLGRCPKCDRIKTGAREKEAPRVESREAI